MRIEGTYTFPATIERVFAALMDPDVLGRALPGCERILQFGPAAADGASSFEVRLRPEPGAGVYTVRIIGVAARRPAHLRVDVRGRGPQGLVTGSGLIDLVAQDEFTVGAYVFDVAAALPFANQRTAEHEPAEQGSGHRSTIAGVPEGRAREAVGTAQRFARATCERLADVLRPISGDEQEDAGVRKDAALERSVRGGLLARTKRGRIVAMPPAPSVSPLSANADAWMERVGWMATGMVLGMVGLGLLVGLSRLLGRRDE